MADLPWDVMTVGGGEGLRAVDPKLEPHRRGGVRRRGRPGRRDQSPSRRASDGEAPASEIDRHVAFRLL
jgi:hypothetical protein